MNRDWQWTLSHFMREGNACAHILAKRSPSLQAAGITLLPDPPDDVRLLLFFVKLMGVARHQTGKKN